MNKPTCLLLHRSSGHNTTKPNKRISRRFCLSICCSIANHHHGLVTILFLNHSQSLWLTLISTSRFIGIKPSIISTLIKGNCIGINSIKAHTQNLRDGFNHQPESTTDQINISSTLMQCLHQTIDTWTQFQWVLLQTIGNVCLGWFDDFQTGCKCIFKFDIAIHSLGSPSSNLWSFSECIGKNINSLFINDCGVYIETHCISLG
mmetsp:Transcript_21094/g.31830  ORF Transcript_21094/g.31830 Transcript_21094/m.31830 type:complete len:204 (+) Transcript_21094:110-721(+)